MPLPGGARAVSLRDRGRGQLVHALDARYERVNVADFDAAMRGLCRAVDPSTVDCVLGFPEGGTPVAYAAAQILQRALVLSSRMPHDLPNEIQFDEPHNAPGYGRLHYIYALRPNDRVLIVEDEITTGVTIINAVRALKAAGIVIDQALVLLAVDDPEVIRSVEAEGVRLTAHEWVPIEVSRAVATNQNR